MQIFRLLGKILKKPTQISDNFYVYSPIILPFHRFRIVRWLNDRILKFNVARVSSSLGFNDPLLWIFMPHYGSLAKNLPAKGIVYYITDEYSSHPNANVEVIKRLEQTVLERAHVVFAVSQVLLERKREFNQNCYLSLHGVDLERFRALDPRKIPVPADMANIPSPIAGFIGFIEEWIDIELLHYIATRHHDVSFVLVGKAMQDVSLIESLPNVYLLGHKPFPELPAYLAHMDVGLLPYRLNTQVINSNPKKLREYLAAGKPIVSVRVREVERYAEFVHIADDYDAYADAIRKALDEDCAALRATRVDAMKNESWERRVDDVSAIVAQHIAVRNEPMRDGAEVPG
jgi:glycosyltransferase involved in cell wall biosynthesis